MSELELCHPPRSRACQRRAVARRRGGLAALVTLLAACSENASSPSSWDARCAESACMDASMDAGLDVSDALPPPSDAESIDLDRSDDVGAADRGIRDAAAFPDADVGDAMSSDVDGSLDADRPDAAVPDGAGVDAGAPTHRTSLDVCWRDASCNRALVVSHGGDWDVFTAPYNSRAAFDAAFACGADGIETDVRVTSDGVPVIAHSSPIEGYESRDCRGRLIEEMTAAEVNACKLFPSQSETFQRLDDLLRWSAGKVVLELEAKRSEDLARMIEVILGEHAEDRVYVFASVDDMRDVVPNVPGYAALSYLVRIKHVAEISGLVGGARNPRVILFELDRSYEGEATEPEISAILTSTVHPAGIKAIAKSEKLFATVANHRAVFEQGFDVVLSYDCANGVAAAQAINAERGIP